jgi:hypothetical protein
VMPFAHVWRPVRRFAATRSNQRRMLAPLNSVSAYLYVCADIEAEMSQVAWMKR